jgi:multicomponent Na+:H+ antiporter subunit B
MRIVGVVLVVLLGAFIVWGAMDLPQRGDPASPAALHESVAVYYIEEAYEETRTPNMVTAVLVAYRGFDTFGEAVVVVAAALSCLLILRRWPLGRVDREGRSAEGPSSGGTP